MTWRTHGGGQREPASGLESSEASWDWSWARAKGRGGVEHGAEGGQARDHSIDAIRRYHKAGTQTSCLGSNSEMKDFTETSATEVDREEPLT